MKFPLYFLVLLLSLSPCFIITLDFRTPFPTLFLSFCLFHSLLYMYIYFSFLCYFQLPSLLPRFRADRTTLVPENFQSFLVHKVSETFSHYFLLVCFNLNVWKLNMITMNSMHLYFLAFVFQEPPGESHIISGKPWL